MRQKFDPHQMTLSQLLLFLVIGGIAVIWLCLEIMPRLHYGDPLYPVDNYKAMQTALASNSQVLLPTEDILPTGDHTSFSVYEQSRRKLDLTRDGYSIGVLGDKYAFHVECSPTETPIHLDVVPDAIRADYTYYGVPVMCSDTDYPQLEFLAGAYYYNISAWGSALPDDALETLLKITDNILQQAG